VQPATGCENFLEKGWETEKMVQKKWVAGGEGRELISLNEHEEILQGGSAKRHMGEKMKRGSLRQREMCKGVHCTTKS